MEAYINELENDLDKMVLQLSSLPPENIQEIRNFCTNDLIVYTGSLYDYDAIYNELIKIKPEEVAKKYVLVMKACDIIEQQSIDIAVENRMQQVYGR